MEKPAAVGRLLPNVAPGAATAEIRSTILRASSLRSRIDSVDLLRGLVMVFMLIDHTRDFVHSAAMAFPPEDLARTTPDVVVTSSCMPRG